MPYCFALKLLFLILKQFHKNKTNAIHIGRIINIVNNSTIHQKNIYKKKMFRYASLGANKRCMHSG